MVQKASFKVLLATVALAIKKRWTVKLVMANSGYISQSRSKYAVEIASETESADVDEAEFCH